MKEGKTTTMTFEQEFPDEAKLYFESSYSLAPGGYQQGYEVFGERGRILVPEGYTQLATARRGEIVNTEISLTDHARNTEKISVTGDHQWKLEVEYFSDCVLRGEQIGFPGENGFSNTLAIDAVYASAGEERIVLL